MLVCVGSVLKQLTDWHVSKIGMYYQNPLFFYGKLFANKNSTGSH